MSSLIASRGLFFGRKLAPALRERVLANYGKIYCGGVAFCTITGAIVQGKYNPDQLNDKKCQDYTVIDKDCNKSKIKVTNIIRQASEGGAEGLIVGLAWPLLPITGAIAASLCLSADNLDFGWSPRV